VTRSGFEAAQRQVMDEESVGILGVLLIVTALVMSQGAQHKTFAAPRLHAVTWSDVAGLFGCSQATIKNCTVASDLASN
jgi:hypothetical protein